MTSAINPTPHIDILVVVYHFGSVMGNNVSVEHVNTLMVVSKKVAQRERKLKNYEMRKRG